MDVIISIVVASIAALFGDIDFFAMYTCVSMALSLRKEIKRFTYDKTAKR